MGLGTSFTPAPGPHQRRPLADSAIYRYRVISTGTDEPTSRCSDPSRVRGTSRSPRAADKRLCLAVRATFRYSSVETLPRRDRSVGQEKPAARMPPAFCLLSLIFSPAERQSGPSVDASRTPRGWCCGCALCDKPSPPCQSWPPARPDSLHSPVWLCLDRYRPGSGHWPSRPLLRTGDLATLDRPSAEDPVS